MNTKTEAVYRFHHQATFWTRVGILSTLMALLCLLYAAVLQIEVWACRI
jgi:hypothetical protein